MPRTNFKKQLELLNDQRSRLVQPLERLRRGLRSAASLSGLPEAIYNELHIPCGVADDPQTRVVLGCGKALRNPNEYKSVLSDSRRVRQR